MLFIYFTVHIETCKTQNIICLNDSKQKVIQIFEKPHLSSAGESSQTDSKHHFFSFNKIFLLEKWEVLLSAVLGMLERACLWVEASWGVSDSHRQHNISVRTAVICVIDRLFFPDMSFFAKSPHDINIQLVSNIDMLIEILIYTKIAHFFIDMYFTLYEQENI